MRLNIIVCCLFVFMECSAQQPTSIDKIVGFVNDQMILESDLNFYRSSSKDSTRNDCYFLEKLITDKLLYSKALKDSIPINEEEVDAELENRMNYFITVFGSQERLEKYYNKTMPEIRLLFRDELQQKLLADRAKNKLLAGMEPSPNDVKEYFSNLHKDSVKYYNSEVQLAQVVFLPKISREAKKALRTKAEKIRKELLNKESMFSTQAILYSDDPGSGSNGGELGFIKHGEMVPEFEQAAFSLPVGQISDIVETKYGLHIIEVMEKKGEKVKVRHILISQKPDDAGIKKAEQLADSVRRQILNKKISFEKAVEIYSDDQFYKANGGILMQRKANGNTTLFEAGDIEADLTSQLSGMKPGDITPPMPYATLDRKVGYRLVKLVSEMPPHKASLETDYYRIKEIVTESLKDKAMTNWLKFYRNYVFVKLDAKYEQCPNLHIFQRDFTSSK